VPNDAPNDKPGRGGCQHRQHPDEQQPAARYEQAGVEEAAADRDPGDGSLVKSSVDERTYGFPSAGDSITLLIDPKTGHIESSPFPELWIVLGVAYLLLGGVIWFFIKAAPLVRASVDPGAVGRASLRDSR
jgi:hypothetical protein